MPSLLSSNDLAAVTLKLAEVVRLLGQCAVKHAGAVNSAVAAREAAANWNAEGAPTEP